MTHTQERVTTAVRMLVAARRQRQEDLAAVLGVTQPSVSAKMRGRARWSVDDLDKLAEHFDVPLHDLLSPPTAYLRPTGSSVTHRYQSRMALVVELPNRRRRPLVVAA